MSNYFRISEAGSIALHAMVMLSNNSERLVRIKDIAGSFSFSEAHLAKVLNRLVKSALVNATRGPSGGYKLSQPAGEITLKEIYEAIEGKLDENRCMFSIPVCDGTGCSIGEYFTKKSGEVEEIISRTTLSDICVNNSIKLFFITNPA